MTTKRASEVQVGDKVFIEDTGERVTVQEVSRGFWGGTVMLSFKQKTVGRDWACVPKGDVLQVEVARS